MAVAGYWIRLGRINLSPRGSFLYVKLDEYSVLMPDQTNIAGLSLPFFGGLWEKGNGKRITVSMGKLAKKI